MKLNKTTIDELTTYLRHGHTINRSCEMAGINVSSFYTWRKRGKVEKKGIYFELFAALRRTETELESKRQERLSKLLDRKIALVKKQFQENDRPIWQC